MFVQYEQTDTQADKKVKTEGPKIMSIDICYILTVIFGGLIKMEQYLWEL